METTLERHRSETVVRYTPGTVRRDISQSEWSSRYVQSGPTCCEFVLVKKMVRREKVGVWTSHCNKGFIWMSLLFHSDTITHSFCWIKLVWRLPVIRWGLVRWNRILNKRWLPLIRLYPFWETGGKPLFVSCERFHRKGREMTLTDVIWDLYWLNRATQ